MTETGMLTLAYLTDVVIGDPHWAPHPVRAIGRGITISETLLRQWFQARSSRQTRAAGMLLAVVIPSVTYAVFYILRTVLMDSGIQLFTAIVMIYLIASSLATRELIGSAGAVIDAVREDDLSEARRRLSMIVGRDTENLDRHGIIRAVVETLAENASDGIVAPMFYFVIGGLPLAMAYKAVNTLDSMVGYKNDTYRDFGWASARLDDMANFIPARITGLLIVAAAYVSELLSRSYGSSGSNAWNIMRRDGGKHASPNSGVPEAAMAGALGIRLGGPSTYNGVRIEKPYIGDDGPGAVHAIAWDLYLIASVRALSLVKLTSVLSLVVAVIVLQVRTYW